ncbi:MAG: FkbM family methyltransferase [Candidatus Aenigmatarchaeota archaeon]
MFLDIGAHLGRYSIIASKNFKKIYAFEPHPENFKMLRKNIKINRIKNVVPIKIALSNKNGKVFLSDLCMDTGHVKIVKKGKIIAFVSTLNRIMRKMKISPKDVDLVKIDVEGEEENIIKGATTLLKKGNPILIIECRPEKMEKLLLNYGYHKVSVLDYHNAMFSRTTEKDLSLKV